MAELVRPLFFHIQARRREVLLLLGLCVSSFLAAGVKGAPIGFGMNPIPTQLG